MGLLLYLLEHQSGGWTAPLQAFILAVIFQRHPHLCHNSVCVFLAQMMIVEEQGHLCRSKLTKKSFNLDECVYRTSKRCATPALFLSVAVCLSAKTDGCICDLLGLNMDTMNDSQASVFNSICQTDNCYLVVNILPVRFVHDNMQVVSVAHSQPILSN